MAELLSEHGPQFKSQKLESFLQDSGIKHSFSAAYQPQANEQIERFNSFPKSNIQLAILEQNPINILLQSTWEYTEPLLTVPLNPLQQCFYIADTGGHPWMSLAISLRTLQISLRRCPHFEGECKRASVRAKIMFTSGKLPEYPCFKFECT